MSQLEGRYHFESQGSGLLSTWVCKTTSAGACLLCRAGRLSFAAVLQRGLPQIAGFKLTMSLLYHRITLGGRLQLS